MNKEKLNGEERESYSLEPTVELRAKTAALILPVAVMAGLEAEKITYLDLEAYAAKKLQKITAKHKKMSKITFSAMAFIDNSDVANGIGADGYIDQAVLDEGINIRIQINGLSPAHQNPVIPIRYTVEEGFFITRYSGIDANEDVMRMIRHGSKLNASSFWHFLYLTLAARL